MGPGLRKLLRGAALAAVVAGPAAAEPLRVAAWVAPLSRDGPGLLLRDLLNGEDAQAEAALTVIAAAQADLLLLMNLDWDADGAALDALATRLAEAGLD